MILLFQSVVCSTSEYGSSLCFYDDSQFSNSSTPPGCPVILFNSDNTQNGCRLSPSRQSHPPFRRQLQMVYLGCTRVCLIAFTLENPMILLLWFSNLLELQTDTSLGGFWFILKDSIQGQPNGRDAEGKAGRGRVQSLCSLSGHATLPARCCGLSPGCSYHLGFIGYLMSTYCSWGSHEPHSLAIPFSSGPHSVRPLHHDPFVLGDPTRHGLVSLS